MSLFKKYIFSGYGYLVIPLCLLIVTIHYNMRQHEQGPEISSRQLHTENGFSFVIPLNDDVMETGNAVTEFVMLSCPHCIQSAAVTDKYSRELDLKIKKSHPFFNDSQRRLSIFFYLVGMDEGDNKMISFGKYLAGLGKPSANHISDEDLYSFYSTASEHDQPLMDIDRFRILINGKIPSEALNKANKAASQANSIGLAATPVFLYKDKITTFARFNDEKTMFFELKNLVSQSELSHASAVNN